MFNNVFANSFCAVHKQQLKFANTSFPALDCCVKAALGDLKHLRGFRGLCFQDTHNIFLTVVKLTLV